MARNWNRHTMAEPGRKHLYCAECGKDQSAIPVSQRKLICADCQPKPLVLAAVEDFREDTYWLCPDCLAGMQAKTVPVQPTNRPSRCDRCGTR